MYLNSFNHFRAIAIIFIVLGHTYALVNIDSSTLFNGMIKNLLLGGTTLFVFISGFLFHHIFYKSFNYKKFLKKKTLNVLLPYIFLSFVPIILFVVIFPNNNIFLTNQNGFIFEMVLPYFKYFLSGRFLTAYWYIPFIFIIFILSPIFINFIKLNLKTQIMITTLLFTISILIHRPISNINTLHSVLYFLPVYLLGILFSIYKTKIYYSLKHKEFYLLIIIILIALFQSYIGISGNYHKNLLEYNGVDLMLIQKTLMSIFFMIILHRFENFESTYINIISNTSFAIFFIHPFLIYFISKLKINNMLQGSHTYLFLWFTLIIILSIVIAQISRRLLNDKSRYLIGY